MLERAREREKKETREIDVCARYLTILLPSLSLPPCILTLNNLTGDHSQFLRILKFLDILGNIQETIDARDSFSGITFTLCFPMRCYILRNFSSTCAV